MHITREYAQIYSNIKAGFSLSQKKKKFLSFWVNLCKAVAVLQINSVSRGNQKTSPVLKLFKLIHRHKSRHLFVYSF